MFGDGFFCLFLCGFFGFVFFLVVFFPSVVLHLRITLPFT